MIIKGFSNTSHMEKVTRIDTDIIIQVSRKKEKKEKEKNKSKSDLVLYVID